MVTVTAPEEYSLDDLLMEEDERMKVVIKAGKGEKTFWIRPPTETEKVMAQNAARQKSRALRERLIDPENEEHQLLIKAEMDNMTQEEMRSVWLASNLFQKTFELTRRSLDNREDFFVPAPEGQEDGVIPPTSTQMDEYETAKRKVEQDRLENVADEQEKLLKELQEQSQELPIDKLAEVVQPILVELKASAEWNAQYGLQILIRCTFLDQERTKRAFEGTGAALRLENSPGGKKVLDELLQAHSGLMLDPDRLKN